MEDLNKFREEINSVDAQILKLLLKRLEISKQIANYKKNNNMKIFQPQREKELLESKIGALPIELSKHSINFEQIFQEIMKLSKEIQKEEIEK